MNDDVQNVDLISPNLAEANRAALSAVFPGVLADGILDVEALADLLGLPTIGDRTDRERYGLQWAGKRDAVRALLEPGQGALVPNLTESIGFETARNVFIEGDNLEVLKLLQKAYNDRVKLIYIDPPYNTGNDFVYNDDFSDGLRGYLEYSGQLDEAGNALSTNRDTGGRKHSRWLSMLYPRLLLARNLLTPDGVLLVSIDDDELPRLRLLLEEVFGEENFATTFIWQKKKKPSFLHANVGSLTEYIVCMTRNSEETFPFSVDVTTAGKKYPVNNAGNSLGTLTFPPRSVVFSEKTKVYEPQDMSAGNIVTRLLDRLEVVDGRNVDAFRLEGEWRYSQTKLNEILANGEMITISKAPFRPNHVKLGGEVKKMHNLLIPQTYQVQTNEDGTAQVERMLGPNVFSNPKPTGLIKLLVKAITYNDPEAIVLDFFAGSGTTAHAVADLNAEDGGRRTSISVNLPEATGAESAAARHGYKTVSSITLARLRKVFTGGDDGLRGLRVFRLEDSCFRRAASMTDELDLTVSTLSRPEASADDIAAEVLLKEGIGLDVPWTRVDLAGHQVIISGRVAVVVSFSVDDALVDRAFALGASVVVFMEDAFAGADAVKANAVTKAKNAGIVMKAV